MFAFVAAVVSLIFAAVVASRWRRSRSPAFAAWAIGLTIFALAAAFQAVGEARGFTPLIFRGFYLFGGVLGVAYLALGTLFLLAPRRVAWVAAGIVAGVTVAAAVDAAVVPVDRSQLMTSAGVLGRAIDGGSGLHLTAVLLNIIGSVILVGGSGWSAYRFARERRHLDRVTCNVLLTIGAFIIAAGFSAAKVKGAGLDVLGLYETIGIVLMFVGFLSIGHLPARRGSVYVTGRAVSSTSSSDARSDHAQRGG